MKNVIDYRINDYQLRLVQKGALVFIYERTKFWGIGFWKLKSTVTDHALRSMGNWFVNSFKDEANSVIAVATEEAIKCRKRAKLNH